MGDYVDHPSRESRIKTNHSGYRYMAFTMNVFENTAMPAFKVFSAGGASTSVESSRFSQLNTLKGRSLPTVAKFCSIAYVYS